jgi:hypothetical protein
MTATAATPERKPDRPPWVQRKTPGLRARLIEVGPTS